MSAVAPVVSELADEIAQYSARLGAQVIVDKLGVLDRGDAVALRAPGRISPNGACRLIAACDGWIAVNMPRAEDEVLIAAWLGEEFGGDIWSAIEHAARAKPWRVLIEDGRRLGLAVAGVGEIHADAPRAKLHHIGAGGAPRRGWRVIDLSSLWAGPLCGALLADMGAEVVKYESIHRPDTGRDSTPGFFARLNGAKAHAVFDHRNPKDLANLRAEILAADVVITSARPRVFAQWGMTLEDMFAGNPRLVWAAVTGYGWFGEGGSRVAFGDDAAAAGGLVRQADGAPEFLGDALADPLTGLAAAAGVMASLAEGGGYLVDAAMARISAGAAAMIRALA